MSEPTRVEKILLKLDIEYEKRGPRLWALCPYHKDTHPSWMIRPSGDRAGQHHCYVCKKGGGLPDLVMHVRGYANFASVLEWLRNFEEAPAPPVQAVTFHVLSHTKKVFKMPPGVIFEPFEQWPTLARRYAEERGFACQVARWRIGYAVEGRLSGRIVFPVWMGNAWSEAWHPASYQARTFVDHEIRYYFPKESEGPNLNVMFGACHFPMFSVRRRSRVYVTEGAINALAVERALEIAKPNEAGTYVAALGSSDVREAHVGLLATFGEVVIVTDNDPAGNHAAEELGFALSRHTKIDRVRFAPKEDPASVSLETCRRVISSAQPR